MAEDSNVISDKFPLKSTADSVFDFYRRSCNLFPEIMLGEIQSVELINGCWEAVGSERLWTFRGDQAPWKNCKDIVEQHRVFGEKSSIIFTLQEVKKPYKSLKVTYQFSPMGDGCEAEVSVTFVKENNNSPNPNGLLAFHGRMVQAVGSFLRKSA